MNRLITAEITQIQIDAIKDLQSCSKHPLVWLFTVNTV